MVTPGSTRLCTVAIVAALAPLLFVLNACEEPVSPQPNTPLSPEPDTPDDVDTVTLQDDVKIIATDTRGTSITEVTTTGVSFAEPVTHQQGEVLVIGVTPNTPRGLLRKVTAVSDDRRTVVTEQATLEDVIDTGRLHVSGELFGADLTPESRTIIAESGVVMRGLPAQPATVDDTRWTTYDFPRVAFERDVDGVPFGVVLDGSLSLSVFHELDAYYDQKKLHRARFTVTLREMINLNLAYTANISSLVKKIKGRKLEATVFPRPLTFLPIYFQVGPVPVVVVPQFQIYLGVDATGYLSVDVAHDGSLTIGVECTSDCNEAASWKPIVQPESRFRLNEAVIGARVKGYVRPEVTVALYDVFGPYAAVEAYASVGGEGGIVDQQFTALAYVEAGVDGSAGVKLQVPILGWTLKDVEVIDFPIVRRHEIWRTGGRVSFGTQEIDDYSLCCAGSKILQLTLPVASGGDPPLRYSLTPVPSGLSFDATTRMLTGTPTAAAVGAHVMTYRVTDREGDSAALTFTVTVDAAPLSFGSQRISDRTYTAGTAISALTLPQASGGEPPLRYSLEPVPSGLSFDRRTLSGTPTTSGTHRMTYTTTDRAGSSESLRFDVTVQAVSTTPPPNVGRKFRDCAECPLMVEVPSGVYTMGSPPMEDGSGSAGGPRHTVTIGYRLAVGVYEVTFAEWDACVADGGCDGYRPGDYGWGRGTRPVILMDWNDAQAYVAWLSRKTGRSYRLLSESEWEYVARAGTTTRYHTGDTITPSQANYYYGPDSSLQTVEVGSYAANAFGLHDVHGNVWEFTRDCWNRSYTGAPTDGSARETGDCDRRVVRGGSWLNNSRDLRSAFRFWFRTGFRLSNYGFRVARTLSS